MRFILYRSLGAHVLDVCLKRETSGSILWSILHDLHEDLPLRFFKTFRYLVQSSAHLVGGLEHELYFP